MSFHSLRSAGRYGRLICVEPVRSQLIRALSHVWRDTRRGFRRACLPVVLCAAVAGVFATASCGGEPTDSERRLQEAPLAPAALPGAPPVGPPAGLRRGVQDGLVLSVNGGAAHVQLNDLATDVLRAQLQGNDVSVRCGEAEGTATWPPNRGDLTLFLAGAQAPDVCMISAGGQELVRVALAPIR